MQESAESLLFWPYLVTGRQGYRRISKKSRKALTGCDSFHAPPSV